MKLFLIFVIIILLLQIYLGHSFLTSSANSPANIDGGSDVVAIDKKHHYHHKKINCGYACSRRCRESSRKNVCHRACRTCCLRCQCVPPGTYGNKHVCPCYASLRTHGNKPKCP
ncbi:gibberellin-regulated protein 9 [Ricinus communis]|uniref:Gibberellin-regulated protein 1, putative n=1 Tax=Ricinus communis TaxID=3988 RepID=B9SLF3_RICCO|nr:gibberellin-regulated protein 9 [Ricinus communis]EEF35557.1 Gibberellin-regulated protein 1 precursor, putative [Ricinus communis]|eukprot:XP_002526822.1 gibberellin-regulated protein 9 [Ricinus communis]